MAGPGPCCCGSSVRCAQARSSPSPHMIECLYYHFCTSVKCRSSAGAMQSLAARRINVTGDMAAQSSAPFRHGATMYCTHTGSSISPHMNSWLYYHIRINAKYYRSAGQLQSLAATSIESGALLRHGTHMAGPGSCRRESSALGAHTGSSASPHMNSSLYYQFQSNVK